MLPHTQTVAPPGGPKESRLPVALWIVRAISEPSLVEFNYELDTAGAICRVVFAINTTYLALVSDLDGEERILPA